MNSAQNTADHALAHQAHQPSNNGDPCHGRSRICVHRPTTAPAQPSNARRPAQVLEQLKQGRQRFLEGHSLHPHSSRARMLAVGPGYYNLHRSVID